MPSFKKSLASIYTVNILNGVMGILFIPLSLKFLGAEGYGLFSIYTVIASFVALLDAGIGKSLQRALSIERKKELQRENIQNACGAYLLVLCALAAALPGLIFLLPIYIFPVEKHLTDALHWIIFFSCIEFLLFIPLAINQSICFANEEFEKHAKFSLISGIARYAVLFAAICFFDSVVMVVCTYVLRRIVDHYLSNKIIGSLPKAFWRPRFDFSKFRELGTHAVGLSITRILQNILLSMGSVMVNRSFGLESLGYFRAAFDLASKVWFISNGLGLIIYPKLVKAFAARDDSEKTFMRLRHAMLISWIIFVIGGVSAGALSSTLLPHVKLFDGAMMTLFIPLVLGVCINAHANLGYEVIQAYGGYRILNLLSIVAIAIMAGLFFFLKPVLGLSSIAWAWLFSQFFYGLLTDLVSVAAVTSSLRERAYSVAMRATSIVLSLLCLFSVTGHLSKATFAIALASQIAILIFCLSSFKTENSKFSDA
jgi:O-antigen/teichoic acid export membrane protein